MEQVTRWLCLKLEACKEPPLVSVIMPMRDRAAVVGDAVRSVLEQTYPNFELIVVDDGSRDDSVSVVRSFTDPRIRLLESSDPVGVSAARNRGLAAARGDLIAYLDSDNTWRPDYLRAMAGFFQIRPDADAAYSGQYLYRGCESEPFAVRFGSYNPIPASQSQLYRLELLRSSSRYSRGHRRRLLRGDQALGRLGADSEDFPGGQDLLGTDSPVELFSRQGGKYDHCHRRDAAGARLHPGKNRVRRSESV